MWVPEILAREFRKFWHVLRQWARPLLSSGDGCARRVHRGDKASALEDAIQNGGRQVLVMQHFSPLAERSIGGEDHGSFSQVAIVDDMKQDIAGVGTVR